MTCRHPEDRAEVAALREALEGNLSELVSLFRGMQANNVLWSGEVNLDASGQWSQSWAVPLAAVAWWPALEAGITTLTTDGPAGVAPTNGPGVFVFPVVNVANPLAGRVFPALGRQLTIYGTANVVRAGMLAVYSAPQNPA
jgi:hypothetical protein